MILLRTFIKLFITGIFCLSIVSLNAQKRIAIAGIDVINKTNKSFFQPINLSSTSYVYSSVPTYCVNFFSNKKDYVAIDRQNLSLINSERELQKSEDFIDGYMVEQGRSDGVDYILKPIYYEERKTLNIRIYDIAEGTVKCSTEKNLESSIFGIKQLEKQVRYLLHQLMWDCFQTKYVIIRATDPKDKNFRELLIAMGRRSKIAKDDVVEIFELVDENFGDETISRKQILGYGKIKEVQDDNFSVIRVIKNNKQVATAMGSGNKLYCTVFFGI